MSTTIVRIESTDPQGPDAMSLLREAALEARALYPDLIAPNALMPANTPLQERDAYFVAFLDGTPVGCGALRRIDEATAEVRRMFVLQSMRRSGVARALLAQLEQTAASLAYSAMRLETGNRQLPAMALYESSGFKLISPYGEYANDPTSVCYEKTCGTKQPWFRNIRVMSMCRNIKTLFNFDPPVTDDEIRAASLQFVRKVSGLNKPSKANEAAFLLAVDEVSKIAGTLLDSLETNAPPKNRSEEAIKARARAVRRFSA